MVPASSLKDYSESIRTKIRPGSWTSRPDEKIVTTICAKKLPPIRREISLRELIEAKEAKAE